MRRRSRVERRLPNVSCRTSDIRFQTSNVRHLRAHIRHLRSRIRGANRGPDLRHQTSYIRESIPRLLFPAPGESVSRPPSLVSSLLAALTLLLSACGYYSFTGATIPEHLDTVAIPLTADVSANPFSDLGGTMTRRLVDRFVGQTRLRLETDETQADALLTTEIQRYVIEPAAVGGENTAQLNRLTIGALATYFDRENNEQVFERAFTASVEYNPANLATEEEAALEAIDNITEDIFTAATSNW